MHTQRFIFQGIVWARFQSIVHSNVETVQGAVGEKIWSIGGFGDNQRVPCYKGDMHTAYSGRGEADRQSRGVTAFNIKRKHAKHSTRFVSTAVLVCECLDLLWLGNTNPLSSLALLNNKLCSVLLMKWPENLAASSETMRSFPDATNSPAGSCLCQHPCPPHPHAFLRHD